METFYLALLFAKLVLPAGLLISIALRPFGFSIIYLLLYLITPLIRVPREFVLAGCLKRFLFLNIGVSILLLTVHIAWHIVLASFPPYGSLLDKHLIIQKIGHNLGLVSYASTDPWMALQFLAPEIVMCSVSCLVYIMVKKFLRNMSVERKRESKHQKYPFLTNAGKYVCVILILFSGIMRPSVTSGIYFLVFLGVATAWSLGRPLEKGFAVVCRCLSVMMALHVILLLVYQCEWLLDLYPPENDMARYFGLTRLVIFNGTEATFTYGVHIDQKWATLACPLIILITYFALVIETKELFKPKEKKKSALTGVEAGKLNGSMIRGVSFQNAGRRATREKWMNATKKVRVAFSYVNSNALRGKSRESDPLMRPMSPKRRWSSLRMGSTSKHLHQDSIGSVIVTEENVSVQEKQTLMDEIMAAFIDFFQVLIRSSYIATTITMMAWSIMYHSWLTFVLLMWANIVWLCQDQRSFMLKTSPILVCYAILLLLAQYIYAMDLYENELPTKLPDVNILQIGFCRSDGEPFVPLLIKSLFTCMFWVTLRQRVQEINHRKRSALLTDMAAPLQLTVSTAASVTAIETAQEDSRSRLFRVLGDWVHEMCVRYWIYVVVIMLFVIGITGDRMTIFRIIYMFLFLTFILMFQISWYWWRRLMYIFWITVIIYSMSNLILIYVYQFDNFCNIISDYLFINEKLQHDLGLEPYHPADLFVKLLTPTLFLIMTIMQVHYFHKDFMALSDFIPSLPNDIDSTRPSQAGASTTRDDIPQLPLEDEHSMNLDHSVTTTSNTVHVQRASILIRRESIQNLPTVADEPSNTFRTIMLDFLIIFKGIWYQCVEIGFMYLDLHLIKIIFLSLMLLCAVNVCALHVPIMLLISPALWWSLKKQRLCILFISSLISLYFMAQMVYQIDYIEHSLFDVNCTENGFNMTNHNVSNNAKWIGFSKTSINTPLVVLLKGYIGLIAVFTFYSLVTYRQQAMREKGLLPKENEKIMFPEITRKEADIDLIHCIKYLVNYGFYKFGVEVTLICLMGVIGSRMDVYAVLYAGWLLVLVSVSRRRQARLWPAFTATITVLVPAQYMMAVGFIPQLCVNYPWSGDDEQMKHIRTWLFLPYHDQPPHAAKLIFDYFLLLFASRQHRVFLIEKNHGDNYKGGSNSENVGQDWETPSFVNPVPDFLGNINSWLDVVKRLVFLGMLWVTLAIMFMTGTNRVNLFSIGYLIGSFIFLWQGTDFYLRPKDAILHWWSWLVRYNVVVVAVKAVLQIPGCIYSAVMQEHACWLVQLLGIGCVDKFAGGNIARFLKMSYNKEAICSVPQEDIGLAWDGVCFAFLILQRRLFQSYYFYRVIDESKATTILASRGAELIEELRQKQMKVQEDQEIRILEKIKVKMERIKANQKKIQGVGLKEPRHHDCEPEAESRCRRRVSTKRHEACYRPSQYKPPASHQKAVRSGDYYMFEEFDDTEVQIQDEEEESSTDEDNPKEMGIGKLLSAVIKTDLKQAVRRASAPTLRPTRMHSASSAPPSYMHEVRRRSSQTTLIREDDIALMERELDSDEVVVESPEKESCMDKLKMYSKAVYVFISSVLISATRQLMKCSRDYRYVSRTLFTEKKKLKEKQGFGIGLREGSQMIWEPLPETLASRRKLSDISVPEIRILAPSMERGLDASPPPRKHERPSTPDSYRDDDDTSEHESAFSLQTTSSKDVTTLEEHDDSLFNQQRSPILHLLLAMWFALIAHTDILCYIMVFINQIQSATILSIPLPLMVFMWGTLTIPRPTKTFWVTIIAYTEVIVLIKSMFQFEILPWNQKAIPANMPFTAPRIIGIERKFNYALYDLLLLLIIFAHRFMLKSLGLWKESTPDIELREDVEYQLTPEDTQLIVDGQGEAVGRKYVKIHDQTGPRHRLVDRLYHVEATIHAAMKELDARRSDPRVAALVWRRLQDHAREENTIHGASTELHRVQVYSRDGNRDDPTAGPSRPSDDDGIRDDNEPIISVTTHMEDTRNYFPNVILLSMKRYLRPIQYFFKRMLEPTARVTADVYAYMFLCDFFNFLVVIFGFAAFGTHQGDGGVQAYLEENKVPIPFLVMLILQFGLIVIDRALYLRKFMLGKILFQYALIIGVHIWMFFVLPFITERTFNSLLPPPMWYMVKCIYLLLSAHQIRCGYPRRIIGNFLCKSYNFINMVFFRAFMAVPFVFELRTLMDWIWTDTSMTLMDWLKMEDIFASVFLLKCSRYIEDEYPQPRGAKKSNTSKYLLGGGVLAFVIAIIWFPLVFFAFGNTVGQPNPPTDVTVKIRIGPFLPVYQMSAQSHNIDVFSEQDFTQLSNMYARDRTAQTFLSNYMYNDVAVISINPNSTMSWEISPPELERLEQEAISNSSLTVKFTYVITHPTNAVPNPPVIEDSREVELPATVRGRRNLERDKLLALLDGSATPDTWLNVKTLFPKFLKVFNKGSTKAANQFLPEEDGSTNESRMFRDVQLRLERDRGKMYWRVREGCTKPEPLATIPMNDCNMLIMYTFNDKLFPETLNFISGSGIIGLYTTFVFLASRVLRGFFSGIYTKIMFDDLPNVDRVLQLCLDIYLVREALELTLEEDLFAKLVFLYRSPETMIKWSRPKEDESEIQRALPPSR